MNVSMNSCGVSAKSIGKKKLCTRVIITVRTSMPSNEFATLLAAIEEMFQNTETNGRKFCVIFDLHSGVALGPLQMGSLVMTLGKYRHITKKHSITTAIVASKNLSGIINVIFEMYKPVGHVKVTDDLIAAKEHCKSRACAYESSIDGNDGSEVKVDESGSSLPK